MSVQPALSGYMPHATCYKLQATATVDTDGAAAAAVQQFKTGRGDQWPSNLKTRQPWQTTRRHRLNLKHRRSRSLSGFHTACPGCDRSGWPCIRPRVGELWPNNLGYPRLTRCTRDNSKLLQCLQCSHGETTRLTGNYLEYSNPSGASEIAE